MTKSDHRRDTWEVLDDWMGLPQPALDGPEGDAMLIGLGISDDTETKLDVAAYIDDVREQARRMLNRMERLELVLENACERGKIVDGGKGPSITWTSPKPRIRIG